MLVRWCALVPRMDVNCIPLDDLPATELEGERLPAVVAWFAVSVEMLDSESDGGY